MVNNLIDLYDSGRVWHRTKSIDQKITYNHYCCCICCDLFLMQFRYFDKQIEGFQDFSAKCFALIRTEFAKTQNTTIIAEYFIDGQIC